MRIILAVLLTAGCTYVSPPIRLEGRAADLEALAGKWSGEYFSDGLSARRGTIAFALVAGEDHAHGEVLMIPEGLGRAYQRYGAGPSSGPSGSMREFPPPVELLTIRFIRMADRSVYGVLDPYWDPDRSCQTWTTFRGQMRGRVIEGTFTSTYAAPFAMSTGRWKVERER